MSSSASVDLKAIGELNAVPEKLNIAVIGGGIAGLTAAYLLSQKHNVTMYEQHEAGGLDAFSVDLGDRFCKDSGKPAEPLDVPFRIHTPAYYPNLVALCEHANIETQLWENTATFTNHAGDTFFSYSTVMLSSFFSMPFLNFNVSPLSGTYIRMLYDLFRFRYFARRDMKHGKLANKTLEQYLTEHSYSPLFADRFLYPFMAGLCTCSYESVKSYPVDVLVQFWQAASGLQSFRRFKYGSRDVVKRLGSTVQNRKFNCKVKSVMPVAPSSSTTTSTTTETANSIDNEGWKVVVTEAHTGEQLVYDHVVIATQANHALQMLKGSPLVEESQALAAFKYEPSKIIVHSDLSLVPNFPCPTKWNIMMSEKEEKPMINLWLNKVYPSLPQDIPIFETWNPWTEPSPEKLWSTVIFERPLVSEGTASAVDVLQQHQGRYNIWFCGAYASHGVPLLESGVRSAKIVATRLGASIPWEKHTPKRSPKTKVLQVLAGAVVAVAVGVGCWHVLSSDAGTPRSLLLPAMLRKVPQIIYSART